MTGVGPWISGGLMGLFGLFGLFLASRALEAPVAVVGWLMFLGAIFFIFTQVKGYFDRIDAYHRYHS